MSYSFVIETKLTKHQIAIPFKDQESAMEFFRGFVVYLRTDREPVEGQSLDHAVRGSRFAMFWEVFAARHGELRFPECVVYDDQNYQLTRSAGETIKVRPLNLSQKKKPKVRTNPNPRLGSWDDTGGTMLQIGAVHWLSE